MKTLNNFIVERLKLNKDSKLNNPENGDCNDYTLWKIGDILCGTYSYTMTIPYFYRILKRTEKSFTIVELKKKIESGHYNGSFTEVPDENAHPYGKPITVRVNKFNDVRVKNVRLRKWDGKPLNGCDLD